LSESSGDNLPDGLDPSLAGGAGVMDGIDVGEEKTELDKIFEMMLNPDNIYHFTELNTQEITAFSTLGSLADKYLRDGVVYKWLLTNLQMRVSKQRKGKAETVKITSRLPEQQQQPKGGFGSWFR
jgi:hypothetical protein